MKWDSHYALNESKGYTGLTKHCCLVMSKIVKECANRFSLKESDLNSLRH